MVCRSWCAGQSKKEFARISEAVKIRSVNFENTNSANATSGEKQRL